MAVKRVTYFSVDVEDRPGALADFCAALRDNKVNLKGLWGFGIGMGKAQIISVPQNPKQFQKATSAAGYAAKEGTAFYLTGADRVGALCKTLDLAKSAGMNLHALDALAIGGKFGAYIWGEENQAEALAKALGAK
jgi:prephenate dehydratase